MYNFLFGISLAYIGYNVYCVLKSTVPVWLEKRIFRLKQDTSFEGLNNKRWDTPVGALSKAYACSVLFTSFFVFTYMFGYEILVEYSALYFVVLTASVAISGLMHWNLERWLKTSNRFEKKC